MPSKRGGNLKYHKKNGVFFCDTKKNAIFFCKFFLNLAD